MTDIIGQDLFNSIGISSSGENYHSVSTRLTVQIYFGGSIIDNTSGAGNTTLSVRLYIDETDKFIGEVSSNHPGVSIEGSVAFEMHPGKKYKIWAVQTVSNAIAKSTWTRGCIRANC